MQHVAQIDRIEDTIAVLEIAGITVDFPVSLLPDGVREGQRLTLAIELGEPGELREEPDISPPIMDIQL